MAHIFSQLKAALRLTFHPVEGAPYLPQLADVGLSQAYTHPNGVTSLQYDSVTIPWDSIKPAAGLKPLAHWIIVTTSESMQ